LTGGHLRRLIASKQFARTAAAISVRELARDVNVTLLRRTAPEVGSTTSTNLPAQTRAVNLQILFILGVPFLEAVLLTLEWLRWGFDGSYFGFYVAAGASLPVAVLFAVACINLAAAQFHWPYLWFIPNIVLVHAPSILVGIGFVLGFIVGILVWT